MEKNSKMPMIIAVVLAIAVVGGVVWAMGRNDEPKQEQSSQTETQQSADNSQEQAKDIVALASETESLSTLVTAVKAADLVETLQGEGPYTVFAPTNDAFAALPAGTLDTLLKPESKDQLTSILTYHVVSGEVMSSDLSDGQEVTTVQGGKLKVKIADGKVYIVDVKGNEAEVVQADVEASNGVVHVINGVLLP